jgi:hypothetical protein
MSTNTTHRPNSLENSSTDLRATMVGLCFACPFDQGNPEGCIFHEIRKRSMAERFAWVMHLDDSTKQTLCEKHDCCLSMKEKMPACHQAEPVGACGTH